HDGAVRAHLLVSHTHWDHIQGFPFFAPAYVPSTRIDIHGARHDGLPIRAAFEAQMRAPHFPVGLEVMRGTLAFHDVGDHAAFTLGATSEVLVRTAPARHPNGCLAWRLDAHGRS